MPNNDIETSISIDLSSYTRSLDKAIRQADTLDSALDSISNTKISPIVEIDTGNLSSVKKEMEAALAGSYTADLNIEASELEQAQQLLDRLDAETVSIKVSTDDTDIATTKRKIESLDGETATIDVKANEGSFSTTAVEAKLNELRTLATIDVVLGFADGLPSPEQVPILGSLIEADSAARSLQGMLGEGFTPAQAQESQGLFVGGVGSSQLETAQIYATVMQTVGDENGRAAKSGEEVAAITSKIFTVQAISGGEDWQKILAAADKLYATGMVSTYAEGLDYIAVAFQNGDNRAGDLLDTLIEYPIHFKELGFSVQEMFSTFGTGLDLGVFNTDLIGDLFKEMNIRAKAAAVGSGAEFDALEAIGLADEAKAFQAGELAGKEYIAGLLAKLDAEKITIADILGTQSEDLTVAATGQIMGGGVDPVFQNVGGTVDTAGEAFYGGINSNIQVAQRLIETKVAESFDKAFNISGRLEEFNSGLSEFAALVAGGSSITGAIEKAFNLTGLENTVNRLESAIGNLVIELATIGANIVEGLGNKGAADDIRAGVRDMSEQQLTFDLTLARDGEDVTAAVATAVRRGVESDEVGAAMAAAGSEMLAAGDLQGLQEYVGTLESLADASIPQPVLDVLAGRGIDVTNLQAVNAELKEIQANASTGMANADWNVVQLLQSQGINLSEVAANLDYAAAADEIAGSLATDLDAALFTKFNDLFSGGKFLEGFITAIGTGEGGTAGIFGSEIVTQFQDLPNQLMQGLSNIGGEIPLLTTLQTDLDNTNAKVGEVMPVIGESINTNGKGTFDAFTTAINASAAAMLTQVPIIGEQNAVMQEGLITTSEEVDNLGVSAEGLNTVSLGGLMGQFAALRASAEDQLGYINIQLALLQAGLGALSGFSIDIPGIAGRSGGAHMYGGVIPQGTIGRVHGNEIMAAAPAGTDISVLNQQTSSTIESALASLVGGGAGGGSNVVNNYNNQFVYNVQSNAQGFMSEGAARSARGF